MKKPKNVKNRRPSPTKTRSQSVTSRFKSTLLKLQTFLLFALVPSLFFSYHPRIPIGATESMNLELSIPLIILALLALVSLPTLPQSLHRLYTLLLPHFTPKTPSGPLSVANKTISAHKSSSKKVILAIFLLFAFPLYLSASVFWSLNPLRAVLTTGIAWCIIITLLTIPNLISNYKTKHKLVKVFLYSSLAIAAFCWLQCFLDLAGLSRETTLLCEGCTYRSFGFPHPNGFAIEPQFMGNLLLAPAFLSLYLLFRNPTHRRRRLAISFFLIATLFLTFSRGAIYAFLLASIILLIARLIQTRSRHPLLLIPLIAVAFLISLCTQGFMAELSPTTDTFASGITKSLDQLTLGHLHLTPEQEEAESEEVSFESEPSFEGLPEPGKARISAAKSVATDFADAVRERRDGLESDSTSSSSSIFSGYVEESTTTRLSLTSYALDRWDNEPASLLFGTGLGSAGTTLAQTFPDFTSPKQIIQNQYASILLELGLIGAILLVLGLIVAIKILPAPHKIPQTYLITLALAYSATLFFFSGLPNALHIYLLPVVAYYMLSTSPSTRLTKPTKPTKLRQKRNNPKPKSTHTGKN